jgi:hypothetical protein
LTIDELRAMALKRSALPTISTTNACRVGMSTALAAPSRVASTNTCHILTAPVIVSAARMKASSIMADCVRMRTRRRGHRSAITPPAVDSRNTGI